MNLPIHVDYYDAPLTLKKGDGTPLYKKVGSGLLIKFSTETFDDEHQATGIILRPDGTFLSIPISWIKIPSTLTLTSLFKHESK